MSSDAGRDDSVDTRFLAQERIVDAMLRALALTQPGLLDAIRNVLVDTEFTHTGKPDEDSTVHQQIRKRIDLAADFATDHGAARR